MLLLLLLLLIEICRGTGIGSMTSSFMDFSSYLPEAVSDLWQPVRSFAQVSLPILSMSAGKKANGGTLGGKKVKLPSPCPSLCGIAEDNSLIYVVTAEGYFYQYKVKKSPPRPFSMPHAP